jgi:hypothetical protein
MHGFTAGFRRVSIFYRDANAGDFMHDTSQMSNFCVMVAIAALVLSSTARGELVDIVNDTRSTRCSRDAPAALLVESDAALDAAARLIARGGELDAALASSGYRAAAATVINIGGVAGDAAIRCCPLTKAASPSLW